MRIATTARWWQHKAILEGSIGSPSCESCSQRCRSMHHPVWRITKFHQIVVFSLIILPSTRHQHCLFWATASHISLGVNGSMDGHGAAWLGARALICRHPFPVAFFHKSTRLLFLLVHRSRHHLWTTWPSRCRSHVRLWICPPHLSLSCLN